MSLLHIKELDTFETKFYRSHVISKETVNTPYAVYDRMGNLLGEFNLLDKAEDYIDCIKSKPVKKYSYNELGLAS